MYSGIHCTHGGVSMEVHHWASPHAVYASEPATCVCNKSCNAQDTAHWPVYWHYPLRWKVIEQEVPVINTFVLNQGSTKVNQPVEIKKEALLCAITAKSTFLHTSSQSDSFYTNSNLQHRQHLQFICVRPWSLASEILRQC